MPAIVDIDTTPVYWANKNAYDSGKYRVIANEGSTRSSKSYSLCQLLVDIASGGRNSITGVPYGKKEISIVSPSLPHLKKGARKDTLAIIENLNLFSEADFNRTDQIYTFPGTGSSIEFFGVEDSKRVRGPSRQILFVNECNLISKPTYLQLAMRTSEAIFIDYNPADEFSYVYELADKPGNKKIHSVYGNNRANLPKELIEEIESLKDADENLWKVFGLGLRGTSSETIYTHWKTCHRMPIKGEVFYGQDFGYKVPSALVMIEVYEGAIYIDELIYETGLTTNDLIERYKSIDMTKTGEIFCDSAEPKTIEEMFRAGYNVMSSEKDVWAGIQKVKSMPVYITERSINIIKEIKSYKWKMDKDGRVKEAEEPVKFMDHAMDAIRYAVFTKLSVNQYSWLVG